jgi:predicted MFS family arabinose efflux permease
LRVTRVSHWLTTSADRFGRKRTLLIGALLMLGAGIVFILTDNVIILMAAAIIGVISPSGNEIGPFLSVEQASLTQLIAHEKRTKFFAWYNMLVLLPLQQARSQADGWRKFCKATAGLNWNPIGLY